MTPLTDKLTAIRAELPAVERIAYLNTGSVGPLPRCAHAKILAEAEYQLLEGRINFQRFADYYQPLLAEVRGQLARLIGADADEMALTHHTTDGMNIALWGVNWRPGDELLIANSEHEGGYLPAYTVARRFGLTLRVADLGDPHDLLEKVIAEISPRTRVVALSHVAFRTGALLPIKEITEAAHRVGALVVIDGAQAVGALPVNVHELGVDAYAFPGQKWLCGPEGTGGLYVRRDRLSDFSPAFVGYFSLAPYPATDWAGHFLPAPGARRYEVGSVYWAAWAGLSESLRWLEHEVGYEFVFGQSFAMAKTARQILADVPGIHFITPANAARLLTFTVEGVDPHLAATQLTAKGVYIRSVHQPEAMRLAAGFYNTEDDLERLRAGLLELPDSAPEGLLR